MKITALAPFFGSNRMLASRVGELLSGSSWVGVPFCGGMCELPYIEARTIVANDLHAEVTDLGRVVADPELGPALYRHVRRLVFSRGTLKIAQERCITRRQNSAEDGFFWTPQARLAWAGDYFVTLWMAQSRLAGTDKEFEAPFSVRFTAGGGDSVVRFQSAAKALLEWRRVFRRVTFENRDAFEFLDDCYDRPGFSLYCDPPWPEDGDRYTHRFTDAHQRRLAAKLVSFQEARVVVRYGDHPLIHELYDKKHWTWLEGTSRTQANSKKAEWLLVRNGPAQKEA